MTKVDGLLQKRIFGTMQAKQITEATYLAEAPKCKTLIMSPGYPREGGQASMFITLITDEY